MNNSEDSQTFEGLKKQSTHSNSLIERNQKLGVAASLDNPLLDSSSMGIVVTQ